MRKAYFVKIIDSNTGNIINSFNEIATKKTYLEAKYKSKFRFNDPPIKIEIDRIKPKAGIQLDSIDLIDLIEKENG